MQHGTCPVCRKDLNGDDTTTTEFDANIGETIGSISNEEVEEDNRDYNEMESYPPPHNRNNSARHPRDSPDGGGNSRNNRSRYPHSHMSDDDIDWPAQIIYISNDLYVC